MDERGVEIAGDERPLERSLLLGVAALRWATLAWTVVVVAIDAVGGSFAHPWGAFVLVGAIAAFTAWATITLRRHPATLLRSPAIGAELALDAALVLFDHWAYGADHAQSLGTAWPLAGIIMAGVRWSVTGGVVAGAGVGLVRLAGDLLFVGGTWDGDRVLAAAGTIVLYALTGAVAGFAAQKLREAEHRIAVARAREELARTLHDGVLQTLAVIQRRSTDPDLVALARRQDVELREFLFGSTHDEGLEAALRRAAARYHERYGATADVVVVEPLGGALDEARTEALVGAVNEALNNAGKHGPAAHATIFVDRLDGGAWVFCTVKDDGAGFDPARTTEGTGITRSIRARIAEVGGRAEIVSQPGDGAEVRLWVPG